ncbi:MAG TPA: EAL domain-containing protein, partial [Solirubrobacteraceae bacterium]|nr:EAL domain-containing protein [Solirubrobacteraceae bacterium]
MEHPKRGLLGPGEFIPLAEETNLIVPLGASVLREACRQAALWRDEFPGGRDLYVSVNVAGQQLQRAEFVEEVRRALAAASLPSRCLMLEVTESCLPEDTHTQLHHLRDRSCALGQGFLFARPLPPADLTALLAGEHSAARGGRGQSSEPRGGGAGAQRRLEPLQRGGDARDAGVVEHACACRGGRFGHVAPGGAERGEPLLHAGQLPPALKLRER